MDADANPRVTTATTGPTPTATAAARIEVRYYAAARAAAGHEVEEVGVSATDTLDDLVGRLGAADRDLARVLERCSFLRDSVVVRDREAPLLPCSMVEVLPPFAGG